MALDQQLLNILACPEDKGPLYYFESDALLFNPRLSRAYEILEGIPILLIDEARTLSEAETAELSERAESEGIKPTFQE